MSHQLLREKAYHLLKHKIVTMEYAMGRQLVEQEICQELNIGRTPVREALQRLAREKLLVIIPRKGMFVSDITAWELQKLYEARAMLEPFCVRQATLVAKDHEIKELGELFQNAEKLVKERKIGPLLDLDRKFHQGIVELLQNSYITEMAKGIYDLLARTWYLSFLRRTEEELLKTVDEHLCIVDALASRDPGKAEEAVLEHLIQYRDKVLQQPLRAG